MKNKTLAMKTLYFSIKEIENINQEAKEKGITFSEVVRRTLDSYFETKFKQQCIQCKHYKQ